MIDDENRPFDVSWIEFDTGPTWRTALYIAGAVLIFATAATLLILGITHATGH